MNQLIKINKDNYDTYRVPIFSLLINHDCQIVLLIQVTCWFSFTRSFMDLSDFIVASSALRCVRWISFCASSRSSLAASSR